MEKLNLSADELLSTTRSVRKRLDFDRSVDEKLITECLELAVQAPTGSNSQNWHFLVITDPEKRSAIADIYRKGFEVYANMVGSAGQLAEVAEKYLKKGSSIYIEGRIKTRKWEDKEGVTKYTTEILGDNMTMLGGKPMPEGKSEEASEPQDSKDDLPF